MNENERSRAQQLNILLRNNPLYDIEPYLSQNRIKTSSKSSWSMKKEPNSIFSMLSKTMGRLSKSRRLRRAQKNRNSIRAARGSSQHTLARVRTGSLNIIDSAPTKAQVPIKKKSIHLPLNESTGISEEESDSISLPIRQKKFKEKRLDGLFVSVMITLFVNFPFGLLALIATIKSKKCSSRAEAQVLRSKAKQVSLIGLVIAVFYATLFGLMIFFQIN